MARKHIAALRAKEPGVKIEIRWCPSHQGIEGNEVADGWAKPAADEPDAHGVEWFNFRAKSGRESSPSGDPRPMSSAGFGEGVGGGQGLGREEARKTKNRKYRPSEKKKPDSTVARANKRLASRFYQLKTGHCLTG